jgi:ABC-type sugar transport system substrate-binding protein
MTLTSKARPFHAFLLFGVALLPAGCSRDAPGNATAKPQTVTKPGAAVKYKIAGIGFQNDQFFKIIEFGMKDAAGKQGVELSLGNSGGSLDKEISLIDTYVAAKVNALVIAPTNSKASIPAIERANKAGIKVVTYDSSVDADFPVSNIKSDQVALGKATGEEAVKYIQEKMGGKANIAIVTFLALVPETSSQRNKGFEDEIAKLPGVKVVAKQDAWMADKAITTVEGILAAHPEVNLIWAANEGGTVGAVTAVRNAGKAGNIAVFGTDISDQIAGFLLGDDNVLQAVTGQKPFEIGVQALDTAVKSLKNEPVEKAVRLPGELFTRRKPEDVKKYQDYLRGLNK